MSSYYEPDRAEHWRFIVGLLAGLLLASVAWAVQVLLEPDEQPDPGAAPSATYRSGVGPASVDPPPTLLETCRAVFAMQAASLSAGRPALAQWEVHIGAMNRLVTGAITLEQASAFWDDTRVQARARLDRFDATQDVYAARTARCPGPGSIDDQDPLVGCAAAVAARHQAVRTLGVSLTTWDEHVEHMEMLRHGHLSAPRAQRLWLASWEAGVDQVRDYEAALGAVRGMDCSDGAAS